MLHALSDSRVFTAFASHLRLLRCPLALLGLLAVWPLEAAAQPASITFLTAPRSGTYDRSLALCFTASFSAPVVVEGAPRLALQVGKVTRYATLTPSLTAKVGGERALVFEYVPLAGDADDDGITVASSIDLNGGTIRSLDSTAASLVFSPPDTRGVIVTVLRPPTPRLLAAVRGGANGARLVLEGTADGSSMVLITRSDIGLIGVTMAAANGSWIFEYAGARVGTMQFSVAAENSDGILSADSAPFSVTIVHTASSNMADGFAPASVSTL